MRDGKRTLLFAEAHLAEQLEETASSWVSSWLIDPFVLVPVPARPSGAALVTRMPAKVIGRDGTRQVDVLDLLAQGEYELIRFVALQALGPGRPLLDRDALLEHASSLQQASSPATRFWRLNLMVFPTAAVPDRPVDRLVQGWEANVIAAPENRASDRAFDAFVVEERRGDYLGHLLGNAATAGAMWSGMDAGPYDERTPSGGAATLIALQRTFVRAVVMDDFLVRVARSGLERLLADDSPFDDPVLMAGGHLIAHQVVPESQVGRVLDVLVEATMESPPENALAYRLRGRGLPLNVAPRRLTVLAALRSFGRFSVDKFITVPRFLIFRGQQRIAARFTRTLHGEDGDARIEIGRDPIGDLSVFVRDLQQAEREKAEVLAQLERNVVEVDFSDAKYRELWSAMRTITFSMYDGQLGSAKADAAPGRVRQKLVDAGFDLPDIVPGGTGDGAQPSLVLPTKSSLFPDWTDACRISDDLEQLLDRDMAHLPREIGWLGIDDADAVRHAVESRAESLERSIEVAHERRAELLADLERDVRLHCELELAQGQVGDWLVATEGRQVSTAAVDRLRRTLGRLPVAVLELAHEAVEVDERPTPELVPEPQPHEQQEVPDAAGDFDVELAAEDAHPGTPDDGAEEAPATVQDVVDVGAGTDSGAEVEERPRWWHRLRFWRRRRRGRERGALRLDTDNAAVVAALIADRFDEEVARLDEEIAGLREAESALEREIESLTARVDELDAAARPFREWFARHAQSFAWRLTARMRDERRALAADLEGTRAWLASPLPVSPEEALRLFERFVRRLRRLYLWGLIIPGVVFVLVRTVLEDLARRFGDWLMSTWVGRFVETDIGRVLADAVRQFLGNPWPYLIAFVVIGTLYAFISYYRAWSQRQRKLRQLRSDVDHMRDWVHELKGERSRLQQLERHSADVLSLLSEFLHRPFAIPDKPIRGRSEGPVGGASSTMAVNIAEPLWDASWQGQHAFESRIVARQARRGWLEDAFRRLSVTVEEVTGQPRGTFSVDRLDASARSRRALLHLIDRPDADPRQVVGQRIEREVLREMIGWDLSDALPFPAVIETRAAATDGVDVRLDLLDDTTDGVHPWIGFMLHGLPSEEPGAPSGEWAPWTISVASHDAVRRDVTTVVHAPARYRRDVEERGRASFIPLRQGEIRPVELLIRIDLAGDLPLEDVRGFEGAALNGVARSIDVDAVHVAPMIEEDLDV